MAGLCDVVEPPLVQVEPDRTVECHLYGEEGKALSSHSERTGHSERSEESKDVER